MRVRLIHEFSVPVKGMKIIILQKVQINVIDVLNKWFEKVISQNKMTFWISVKNSFDIVS